MMSVGLPLPILFKRKGDAFFVGLCAYLANAVGCLKIRRFH